MKRPIIYTCAECDGTFEADWTDEEARAEAAALFPDDDLEDMAIVCDECYQEIREAMKRTAS